MRRRRFDYLEPREELVEFDEEDGGSGVPARGVEFVLAGGISRAALVGARIGRGAVFARLSSVIRRRICRLRRGALLLGGIASRSRVLSIEEIRRGARHIGRACRRDGREIVLNSVVEVVF